MRQKKNKRVENESHSGKRILIIRLSALGDIAMSLPVVYSMCRSYPDVEFTMLTSEAGSRLFLSPPGNLTVIVAEVHGRHAGVKGIYRLFRELNAPRYDGVVDLHDVLRTKWLRLLFLSSGIPTAHIDKGRPEKKRLTARRHKIKKQLKTSFSRYADVFGRFGFVLPVSFIPFTKEQLPLIPDFVKYFTDNKIGIGIAPFAQHIGKIYPEDKMKDVIRLLSQSGEYRIFLFGGGEKESAVLNEWACEYPDVVSLAGKKYGLENEMALMSRLIAVISMDSANMHLASLVGTPVISVWGATHRYAGFLGWGQKIENVVDVDLSCRPCSIYGNKSCWRKDYACLYRINSRRIIDCVEKIVLHVTEKGK
ncbi:glycosyltransferase family 9 protein [Coprobacter tertius]|uniref:Glycosyltransferase family 9 protein n=1 Tax=Coprobacter tertius TaxID=2944915 RepID=A0ABT1MDF7_9BACT|nr:glycosyltransferase family 9 protein [Coprobacter tertius]MCP9610650.1 glycosyltransferase family 9 protein [Coprobacter tertius]